MVRPAAAIVLAVAVLLTPEAVATTAVPPALVVAPAAFDQIGSTRLLDVPYLPQSEDLCGGAATAMVLRYWGERRVSSEDFSSLVDRGASGIRTDVLAADVSRRGWQAFPRNTTSGASGDWLREQVDRGRPVVALIEVRPDRYHYIVVVGWTRDRVIAHDPASGPFGVRSIAEFDRAWAAAGRWALLILPAGDTSPANPARAIPTTEPVPVTGACGPLIENMVDLARGGHVAAARSGLLAASELCPRSPAAWRELAGVHFLQSQWAEAATFAERAAQLEPADEAGWDLLATSRFLNDQPGPALDAWNQIGRPAVDLVRVEGTRRTRHPVVVAVLGLPSRPPLTAASQDLAARRLEELPSASLTRLRYRPVAGGLVQVEAVVVERPTLPRGIAPLAATAVRALLLREVRVDASAPTGSGELLTVAWRWWEARPALAVALAVPGVRWLPGVTTIEGSWERQSYAAPELATDDRHRAGLSVADWATSQWRWEAGVALDRWGPDRHVAASAAIDVRLADDRVSLAVRAAGWTPAGSGARFATGGVTSAWRSTTGREKPSWSVSAGLAATTEAAPYDIWPGAGTGHARTPLLRAHPLLDSGVVTGEVFGRQLAHGTIEYQRPLVGSAAGTLRVAVFADAARAWHRMGDNRSPLHTDVGAGLRVALPGKGGGMRVDVARGLRDGRVVLSTGWQAPWPGGM